MQNGGLRLKNIQKTSLLDKPLITIVTVVFNGVSTLEQTILSVINQTYDNIEYIIIDGGSKDGTLDIIKKYEDKIDYWQSEADKGIYDAMNKGVALSYGEWINFMNAGDIFFDDDVIHSLLEYMDIGINLFGNYYDKYEDCLVNQGKIRNFYLKNICHQSILYKKSFLKPYNLKYKMLADWNENLRIKRRNFHYINRNIAIYEGNGVSATRLDYPFYNDYNKIVLTNYGVFGLLTSILYRLKRKILFIIKNRRWK